MRRYSSNTSQHQLKIAQAKFARCFSVDIACLQNRMFFGGDYYYDACVELWAEHSHFDGILEHSTFRVL